MRSPATSRASSVKGDESLGVIGHIVLGIVGALIGGFVAGLLTGGDYISGINVTTIVVAVIGRDHRCRRVEGHQRPDPNRQRTGLSNLSG